MKNKTIRHAIVTIFSTISIFIFGCSHAEEVIIKCKGEVSYQAHLTISEIKKDKTKIFVRNPKSTNTWMLIKKLFSDEKFISFYFADRNGAGVWFINKATMRFSYIQTKELSWIDSNLDFNHDSYTGSCEIIKGKIQSF